MKCIANRDFAKSLKKCGHRVNIAFEVAGDSGSVVVQMTREDGRKMRLNFSKADAKRLSVELDTAFVLPKYGRPEVLDLGGAA